MNENPCTLICAGLFAPNNHTVTRLEAVEGLNAASKYELDIEISSDHNPSGDLLGEPCSLEFWNERRCGFVEEAQAELLRQGVYLLTLRVRSRVQRLAYARENRMYLDKTVPELLREHLASNGLQGDDDVDLSRLTASDSRREFTWQFEESALEFLDRICREEGIVWFVRTPRDKGPDRLCFTDATTRLKPREHILPFVQPGAPAAGRPMTEHHFTRFTQGTRQTFSKLHYVSTQVPAPSLAHEALWDLMPGGGRYLVRGESCDSEKEAMRKARLRKDALSIERLFVSGEGWCPLGPGTTFDMEGGASADIQQAIARESGRIAKEEAASGGARPLARSGVEAKVELEAKPAAGQAPSAPSAAPGFLVTEMKLSFRKLQDGTHSRSSTLKAIPLAIPYRPMFQPAGGRLQGQILARVAGSKPGQPALLDDRGRYRVCFASELGGGAEQTSAWLPLLQPFGGRDHGMHLPLRQGADVLVMGMHGNHEQLVIMGALPTVDSPSVLSGKQAEQALIRSAGGSELRFQDAPGKASLSLTAAQAASGLSFQADGRATSWAKAGAARFVRGNSSSVVQGLTADLVIGQRTETSLGNQLSLNLGGITQVCDGTWTELQPAGDRVRLGGGHHQEWDGRRSVLASERLSLSVLPFSCGKRAQERLPLAQVTRNAASALQSAVATLAATPASLGLAEGLFAPAGGDLACLINGSMQGTGLAAMAAQGLKDLETRHLRKPASNEYLSSFMNQPFSQEGMGAEGSREGGASSLQSIPGGGQPLNEPEGARGLPASGGGFRRLEFAGGMGRLSALEGAPPPSSRPLGLGSYLSSLSEAPLGAGGPFRQPIGPPERSAALDPGSGQQPLPNPPFGNQGASLRPQALPAGWEDAAKEPQARILPDRAGFENAESPRSGKAEADPSGWDSDESPRGRKDSDASPRSGKAEATPERPAKEREEKASPGSPVTPADAPPAVAAQPQGAAQPQVTGSKRPISTLRMNNLGNVDLIGTWINLRARDYEEFDSDDSVGDTRHLDVGILLSAAGRVIIGNPDKAKAPSVGGEAETVKLMEEAGTDPTRWIDIRSTESIQVESGALGLCARTLSLGWPDKGGRPARTETLKARAAATELQTDAFTLACSGDVKAEAQGALQLASEKAIAFQSRGSVKLEADSCEMVAKGDFRIQGKTRVLLA